MGMRWYVVRRVAWAAFATYLILSITFGLLVITPDAQLAQMKFQAAQSGQSPEEVEQAYEMRTGQTGSLWSQYSSYMGNMVTLDWGWSDTRSQPVIEAISEAWPYSVMYGAPAIFFSTILGLGLGLYSATHQHSLADYLGSFVAFFGLSIPNFWFGIVLLLIFGVQLGWVPIIFDPGVPTFSVQNLKQLILPIVVLGTGTIAGEMRYARAEALEYVQADFVKTARAKGADGNRILFRHILRPALVPLMTILIADILGLILTASYLVEVVFGIPGLGRLSYQAIVNQDTALVLGTTLIPVFIAVMGNLFQDIAYTILDPRIDFGDR